ncbi:MAG: hypothetical protein M1825_005337 [Sarcosagium campestre]|nr:MAG: hypothetical protein M1825_005337 [Sarcosagium campestre]
MDREQHPSRDSHHAVDALFTGYSYIFSYRVQHVELKIGSGLCRRRRWPDPLYESYQTSSGFCCVVRVNHREYQTDTVYETETLARENAAMRAYLICRNFSVNDGMYPAGQKSGAIVQGLPVAIGTGRHSASCETGSTSSSGGGYGSGGSSPRSSDGGRDDRFRHMRTASRRLPSLGA